MFDIDYLYKNETGQTRVDIEVELLRMKGEYYLIDVQHANLKRNTENDGVCFWIPDSDYIEWLEAKVMELLTKPK